VTTTTTDPARYTALPAPRAPGSSSRSRRREEVTTMMNKLYRALFRARTPELKRSARFNGQLLDQRRDDAFLAMHQAGLFR
jgi:hypothetical protein